MQNAGHFASIKAVPLDFNMQTNRITWACRESHSRALSDSENEVSRARLFYYAAPTINNERRL